MQAAFDQEGLPRFSFRFRQVDVKEKDEKALKRIANAEDQLIDETRPNEHDNAKQPCAA